MLADGWRQPLLLSLCRGSKTRPRAKHVAKQMQTEQMEQVVVPTECSTQGKVGSASGSSYLLAVCVCCAVHRLLGLPHGTAQEWK